MYAHECISVSNVVSSNFLVQSFGRYLLDLRNGAVAPPGIPTAPTPRSHRMSTIVAPTAAMLDSSKKSIDRPLTQVKYAEVFVCVFSFAFQL